MVGAQSDRNMRAAVIARSAVLHLSVRSASWQSDLGAEISLGPTIISALSRNTTVCSNFRNRRAKRRRNNSNKHQIIVRSDKTGANRLRNNVED
jgi:hypothetical protein